MHDEIEHARGGAHGVFDAEEVEGGLVEGIVHPGDDLGHPELQLGDLGDDDVVFVVTGDRDHHVGPADAGLLEDPDLGAVAEDHILVSDHPGDRVVADGPLLDNDDLMPSWMSWRAVLSPTLPPPTMSTNIAQPACRDTTGPHRVEQRGPQFAGRAHRADARLAEELGAQRIEHPATTQPMLYFFCAIWAITRLVLSPSVQATKAAASFKRALRNTLPVEGRPDDEFTGEVLAQEIEGVGVLVDDGHLEALVRDVTSKA